MARTAKPDRTYGVRRVGEGLYEAAVFEEDAEPKNVYTVHWNPGSGKRIFCNCPGFRHYPSSLHKHFKLVQKFIDLEKEQPGKVFTFRIHGGVEDATVSFEEIPGYELP